MGWRELIDEAMELARELVAELRALRKELEKR